MPQEIDYIDEFVTAAGYPEGDVVDLREAVERVARMRLAGTRAKAWKQKAKRLRALVAVYKRILEQNLELTALLRQDRGALQAEYERGYAKGYDEGLDDGMNK